MSNNDPVEALRRIIATSFNDWALHRGDAWLYGIVLGWDSDPDDVILEDGEDPAAAMREVAARHGWTDHDVARLRQLHAKFNALEEGDK